MSVEAGTETAATEVTTETTEQDTTPTEPEGQQPEETTEDTDTEKSKDEQPKPTETVEYWKQKSRDNEKRAKANADAAKRVPDLEKSLEKATERADEAEVKVLRLTAAIEHGVSAEDLPLLDEVSDSDAIKRLAERLAGEIDGVQVRKGPRSSRDGKNTRPAASEERKAVRTLFGGGAA